jgi:hypothetical protein
MNKILFTEPNRIETVESRKTNTRRLIKSRTGFFKVESKNGIVTNIWQTDANGWVGEDLIPVKPRYQVGEIVYIAEPYICHFYLNAFEKIDIKYLDEEVKTFDIPKNIDVGSWCGKRHREMSKSKSGFCNKMFMPEWAARYFIRITDVKAERLQYINDKDCGKEGIYLDYIETNFFHYHDQENRYYCYECEEEGRERLLKEVLEDRDRFGFEGMNDEWIMETLDGYSADDYTDTAKYCDICGKELSAFKYPGCEDTFGDPREAYAAEIDMINGKGTWDSNPWVWSYYYELVKK